MSNPLRILQVIRLKEDAQDTYIGEHTDINLENSFS